ncbi:C-3',4' desaturase CrtD [Thermosynechococcaceae cyanobacterium BACA0444]|uniref:C-3',4' desaturase CrtD n=1 Tax=Pseudocalidococcus azoricus BACA0444 TaxID=2918990 RepID=A0AAE4FNX6_9CYAN|nr:C-3',4' desaturase CrtD [Pseudocalidococcus azoricus]MDS3859564.1 C-3',4' desaturase CrtD [Pseudocalidococcus azoricus BACA0444]
MGQRVMVIGAGIGGLTAGALLARRGFDVLVLEQAAVIGGCASTFKRRGFTFDVGATQVAGLEPGGIHHRIFQELELPIPAATFCDPACAVYLPDEREPIQAWRDPEKWQQERQRQFPGSEPFWQCLSRLFDISWRFQAREPVLPPRTVWDLSKLLAAVRPDTLLTIPFSLLTVGDLLNLFGLGQDDRLRRYLDLQLKLYSQVEARETALLYAATALAMSQAPFGLYHLKGSMQVLADRLREGLENFGGKLLTRHRVENIHLEHGQAKSVTIRNFKTGATWIETADHIVANTTVQNLSQLLGEQAPIPYKQRIEKLPPASGAFVVYLGVQEAAIPKDCPPHLQFLYDNDGPIAENNSLFVSVSQAGDGRAPEGCRTIIASSFTEPILWWGDDVSYQARKENYTQTALEHLGRYFHLTPETIRHVEAATPRTFARYTARDLGIVGGLGQRLSTFGPFGLATRTPISRLWLVGDSVHPGEGTAGVSYGAWTVVEQILAEG